ncbi:hypothetical protein THIOSC13_870013 [uncultured Thiomicrorhabdus sp.]
MAEEEVQEEKKKGGKGLIITLIVIVILLLVGIGVMAYLLLSQQGGDHANGDSTEMHASAEHGDEPAAMQRLTLRITNSMIHLLQKRLRAIL